MAGQLRNQISGFPYIIILIPLIADCEAPKTLDHADVNYTGTLQYDMAEYTCQQGYVIPQLSHDNFTVTCLPNTTYWEELPYKCIGMCICINLDFRNRYVNKT